MIEYVDVEVRLPKELHFKLTKLGTQCGLSAEQMASAIFALAGTQMPVPDVESEETHL